MHKPEPGWSAQLIGADQRAAIMAQPEQSHETGQADEEDPEHPGDEAQTGQRDRGDGSNCLESASPLVIAFGLLAACRSATESWHA